MEKGGVGTILATAVAAVAAQQATDSVFSAMAVIMVGALGGSVFSLTKMSVVAGARSYRIWEGVKHMLSRGLPSLFCSGILAAYLMPWADAHDVPRTFLLLAVSFAVAAPRELGKELQPLFALVGRIRTAQPPSKE